MEIALQQNLEAQILEEQILLHEILRDGGGEALGRAVIELNSPLSSQRHMVGVFDEKGQHLAGNIDLAPDFVGWQVRSSGERSFLGLEDGHLLNASRQDSLQTVVGRSLAPKNQALATLIEGLLLLSIVVLLTTLSLGYVLSRRNLLKLQTIEQTLNRVSLGDMAARLPVSQANDQIDRIAAQVNEHLEQLSALMTTTKSSVVAIAHDLKTPLSHGFMALQQALGKLDRAEDAREELENLESELERLSSVFDTILRISRIETAGAQTYFDNMDLNDAVREMQDTFAAVADEKGQTLVTGPGNSKDVLIWGDHKMLLQLAYNLVKNAIEHCPSGTKIELLADDQDGARRLIIADDGPGVADDLRASIFDPFFRTSSSRSSGGNGLGLALVRAIATRHGARVRAYDNGPGLRVIVSFPKKDKLHDIAA
ncbi:HAMP domain-containing sensor histidine kinase [Roseibium sp.]|uniref:sensor histidine kinase n=1 Tax=Roseibium sp. TaxID=1936156 RepID=UPI003265C245